MKIDKHTLLTWGGRTMTAEEWAQEPLVWLRGITLPLLLVRITPSPAGPAWDAQSALETPVLDEDMHARWARLLDPPKGREGAEARRMRRALLVATHDAFTHDDRHLAPVPLFVLEHLRKGLAEETRAAQHLTGELVGARKQLAAAEKARDAAHYELSKLRDAVKHHGELSALFGWWCETGEQPATVVTIRIHNTLEKMFKGKGVPS